MLALDVETMSLPLISKLPPSCGELSSTTLAIPDPEREPTDANAKLPEPSVFRT